MGQLFSRVRSVIATPKKALASGRDSIRNLLKRRVRKPTQLVVDRSVNPIVREILENVIVDLAAKSHAPNEAKTEKPFSLSSAEQIAEIEMALRTGKTNEITTAIIVNRIVTLTELEQKLTAYKRNAHSKEEIATLDRGIKQARSDLDHLKEFAGLNTTRTSPTRKSGYGETTYDLGS